MKRLFLLFLLMTVVPTNSTAQSDSQIKQKIIQNSIASYSGNCPCPYNTMRNGRSCGGRSAYSRPGGYSPICYERDVTKEMIEEYKVTHQTND